MLRKNKILIWAATLLFGTAVVAAPVYALDEIQPRTGAPGKPVTTSIKPEVAPTFVSETKENEVSLGFGKNTLLVGNRTNSKLDIAGILVSLGNNVELETDSDYAVVAGNSVNFAGTTRSDLFIAGNMVKIEKDAMIGRDVYATGNQIRLEADLDGDFSVAGASVYLDDVVITGNANISAEVLQFSGNVRIDGTLTYNDDAVISGFDNVKAHKTSTYTPEHAEAKERSASDIWLGKLMSIGALFCTMILVIVLFPKLKGSVVESASANAFGKNLLIGLGVFALTPVASLLLLITMIGAPAGLVALGVYVIMLYLSQGFAGAWLGHVIVEKLCKGKLPLIVETLIGVALLGCVSMIPGIGFLAVLISILFGMGLIVTSIRSSAKAKTVVEEKPAKKIAAKSTKAKTTKSKTTKK